MSSIILSSILLFLDFSSPTGLGVVAASVVVAVVVARMFWRSAPAPQSEQSRSANTSSSSSTSQQTTSSTSTSSTSAPAASGDDDILVLKASELPNKVMQEMKVGEVPVLVIRDNANVYATGTKCSHVLASLKNGAYAEGRIRCALHGACFNARTGDIEDYPCVDGIPAYPVEVKGDEVKIRVKKGTSTALAAQKRTLPMCKADPSADSRTFIIVGGGPAALTCAETLRQNNYKGKILIIGKEVHLPYDRTKLSKTMSTTADKAYLRPKTFLDEHQIQTKLGWEAKALDVAGNTVTVSKDGQSETLQFDGLLIATGGNPRRAGGPAGFLPGEAELKSIYALRNAEEANGIVDEIEAAEKAKKDADTAAGRPEEKATKLVIIGSSFIGMETASCLVSKVKSATVIGMEKVAFERVLGLQIGSAIQKFHEDKGVKFLMGYKVKEFLGENGKVKSVVIVNLNDEKDVQTIEADLIVIGAGINSATEWLGAGITKERDGSVVTDKYLKAVGTDKVYAAGDLARFPYPLITDLNGNNVMVRVEHYGIAQYQGSVVAKNFVGKHTVVDSVPFFWTVQYGKSIRYAGHAIAYDEVFVEGDTSPAGFKWIAYYIKVDKDKDGAILRETVYAVCAVGMDQQVAAAAELLHMRKFPHPKVVRAGGLNLATYLQQLA